MADTLARDLARNVSGDAFSSVDTFLRLDAVKRATGLGFLSHLHSLMVTMSQKSSLLQPANSVSRVLIPDMVQAGLSVFYASGLVDGPSVEDSYIVAEIFEAMLAQARRPPAPS